MKETNNVLWDNYGPRLEMRNKGGNPEYQFVLNIQDMNPPRDFSWCFSRWTMVRIGLWFIRRAIFTRAHLGDK